LITNANRAGMNAADRPGVKRPDSLRPPTRTLEDPLNAFPPILAVYDTAQGKYAAAAEPACTARWATPNRAHDAGDLCGQPASERIGDVDLCLHHFHRALDWFRKRAEDAPERTEELRRKIAEHERLLAEARSVVYYLRRESDGMIKIGFTSAYKARLSTLRAEHGPLRLLLATAGARASEREAHKAFAACRITPRGEWFRPEKELLLYIQRARKVQDGRRNRLPEQVPIAEVRALIRAIQGDERARHAA
jgi:hypothetical protein